MWKREGVLLVCVALACSACSRHEAADMQDVVVKPTDAFRLFAGMKGSQALPAGVSDIQANGTAWQDFTVCCRYSASREVIASIVSNGYERVQWGAIEAEMSPKEHITGFRPAWNPTAVAEKACYIKRRDEEHSIEILRLVVDHRHGVVYAVGSREVL